MVGDISVGLAGLCVKGMLVGKLLLSLGISSPGRSARSPNAKATRIQKIIVKILDSVMNGCQIDNKESKKTQNNAYI